MAVQRAGQTSLTGVGRLSGARARSGNTTRRGSIYHTFKIDGRARRGANRHRCGLGRRLRLRAHRTSARGGGFLRLLMTLDSVLHPLGRFLGHGVARRRQASIQMSMILLRASGLCGRTTTTLRASPGKTRARALGAAAERRPFSSHRRGAKGRCRATRVGRLELPLGQRVAQRRHSGGSVLAALAGRRPVACWTLRRLTLLRKVIVLAEKLAAAGALGGATPPWRRIPSTPAMGLATRCSSRAASCGVAFAAATPRGGWAPR